MAGWKCEIWRGSGQTVAEFKSQFIIDVAISEVGNSFYCLQDKQIKYMRVFCKKIGFFTFFLIFFGVACPICDPFFHLVFRWSRDSNPRPRTMAQIVSPQRSPLDHGDSLSYKNTLFNSKNVIQNDFFLFWHCRSMLYSILVSQKINGGKKEVFRKLLFCFQFFSIRQKNASISSYSCIV